MTIVVAVGMLRAGGRIRRASYAGYWIVSRAGRKRPLPGKVFRELKARERIKRSDVRIGEEWIWNDKQPFKMPPPPKVGGCSGGG